MEKAVDFYKCNALELAYMGDAVVELLARRRVLGDGGHRVSRLNESARRYVTAVAQSDAAKRLLPQLTEREAAVFRYGRNAKGVHVPKSASAMDYRRATGLECLFGYLYLSGNDGRLEELFEAAYGMEEQRDEQ